MPLTIEPMIATTGPMTATMPAICTIISCCCGERFSHACRKSDTNCAACWSIGASTCPSVAPNSAPASLTSFKVSCHWSIGSSVSSNVSETDPAASLAVPDNSSKLSEPSLTALNTLSPDLPNSSYAFASPSASSSLSAMVLCKSDNASSSGIPSSVAFFSALESPPMTVSTGAPDFSSCAISAVESSRDNPISWSAVALLTVSEVSVSMPIPESCAALLSASRYPDASSTGTLKASIAFCTESTDDVTSVSLSSANLTNCPASSSRASPVKPNRVLTSPTASPAVSKSVGIEVARLSTMSYISCAASPAAPVFLMTMS